MYTHLVSLKSSCLRSKYRAIHDLSRYTLHLDTTLLIYRRNKRFIRKRQQTQYLNRESVPNPFHPSWTTPFSTRGTRLSPTVSARGWTKDGVGKREGHEEMTRLFHSRTCWFRRKIRGAIIVLPTRPCSYLREIELSETRRLMNVRMLPAWNYHGHFSDCNHCGTGYLICHWNESHYELWLICGTRAALFQCSRCSLIYENNAEGEACRSIDEHFALSFRCAKLTGSIGLIEL